MGADGENSNPPIGYQAILALVCVELVFAFGVGLTCVIFSFNMLRALRGSDGDSLGVGELPPPPPTKRNAKQAAQAHSSASSGALVRTASATSTLTAAAAGAGGGATKAQAILIGGNHKHDYDTFISEDEEMDTEVLIERTKI